MFNSETYKIPDWSAGLSLEGEQYVHLQAYDALNRSVSEVTGRSGMAMSRVLYGYNESGLLNAVRADASGTGMEDYVREISYNEQGQRTLISYGNGSETRYRYDRATFRMLSLITRGSPGKLQDFHYSYDAVGNISEIHNASEDTLYFNNQEVSASNDYEYDSLYRLIYATGREHIGQLGVHANTPDSQGDEFRVNLPHPGDGNALQGYRQHYSYDGVGNMLLLRHIGGLGSMTHRWSRVFRYNNNEADRDVLGIPAGTKKNNQLLRSESGGLVSNYSYDVHGNMAGLQEGSYRVSWSSMDRLEYVELPGGTSHYWYSIEGVRTRKVLTDGEKIGKERIYYGNLEVYREYTSTGSVRMERESYHVVDDTSRIALVEHKTIDHPSDSSATELLRYQYGNHLGSSSLELDAGGRIISYEEYYAYGTTSYQAQHAGIRSASKRYRYTGMERDEESGLSYHSARYYLPWLARWLNPDPIYLTSKNITDSYKGDKTNTNNDQIREQVHNLSLYIGFENNPVKFTDDTGYEVDFSEAIENDMGREVQNIVNDLEYVTGIDLRINEQTHRLEIVYDENGEPVSAENVAQGGGSQTAREFLRSIINSEDVITVSIEHMVHDDQHWNSRGFRGSYARGNSIRLERTRTVQAINALRDASLGSLRGIDARTFGWGMQFLHEARHTNVGGGYQDNYSRSGNPRGDVVDWVNRIRSEIPGFGRRTRYIPWPPRNSWRATVRSIFQTDRQVEYDRILFYSQNNRWDSRAREFLRNHYDRLMQNFLDEIGAN